MGEQHNFFYRRPEDYGHWDGTTFIFNEPLRMLNAHQEVVEVEHLDMARIIPQERGTDTRDNFLRALLAFVDSDDHDE